MARPVRAAWHALRAARLTEALMIFGFTFPAVLACATLSAERKPDSADLLIAALTGLLAASSWWIPNRLAAHGVAARVDRKLSLGGELLTAWELEEGRLAPSTLGDLLIQRISERLPSRKAARAVLPRSAPWIVMPFVGAGLLAIALELVSQTSARTGLLHSTRELAETLAGLSTRTLRQPGEDGLRPEQRAELGELSERARELSSDLERQRTSEEEASERLAELTESLREFAEAVGDEPELQRPLEASRSLAEAARMALEAEDGDASGAREEAPGRSPGSEVASGGADGTMSDRSPAVESTGQGPASRAPEDAAGVRPDVEMGLTRGRFWPARHDEIVASWVELRRQSP